MTRSTDQFKIRHKTRPKSHPAVLLKRVKRTDKIILNSHIRSLSPEDLYDKIAEKCHHPAVQTEVCRACAKLRLKTTSKALDHLPAHTVLYVSTETKRELQAVSGIR
jgi:hypothetical protein